MYYFYLLNLPCSDLCWSVQSTCMYQHMPLRRVSSTKNVASRVACRNCTMLYGANPLPTTVSSRDYLCVFLEYAINIMCNSWLEQHYLKASSIARIVISSRNLKFLNYNCTKISGMIKSVASVLSCYSIDSPSQNTIDVISRYSSSSSESDSSRTILRFAFLHLLTALSTPCTEDNDSSTLMPISTPRHPHSLEPERNRSFSISLQQPFGH